MRKTLFLLAITVLLAPATASWAKDYKFLPSAEVGGVWWFLYDDNAKSIQVDPNLAYGVSVVQIVDFEWARGMSAEISYFHSKSRGEWDALEGEDFLFDLTNDFAAANIGYHFAGRRIHPFLAGGFGASALKFERKSNDKIRETDMLVNGVGGLDWTVWEPRGGMEQLNIGAYVRYMYLFSKQIVTTGLTATNVMGRIQLRF